jgi:hypothetical protein
MYCRKENQVGHEINGERNAGIEFVEPECSF